MSAFRAGAWRGTRRRACFLWACCLSVAGPTGPDLHSGLAVPAWAGRALGPDFEGGPTLHLHGRAVDVPAHCLPWQVCILTRPARARGGRGPDQFPPGRISVHSALARARHGCHLACPCVCSMHFTAVPWGLVAMWKRPTRARGEGCFLHGLGRPPLVGAFQALRCRARIRMKSA